MSWLELSGGEIALAAMVLAAASFIRGYSGFGFSAVLVGGLAFIIEPVAAVPLAIAFEVVASVVQGRSIRHEVRWHDFWTLLAAALIGNPVGVLILTTVDKEPLQAATFILLLTLSGLLLLRPIARVTPTTAMVFAAGALAGVVNGATALAGLVLVLAMSFTTITPAAMRGTLVAYFFASDLFVLVILFVKDELDAALAWRVVVGLPILTAGIVAGTRAFRTSTEAGFRRVTLGLLITISVVGLGRLALA